MGVSTFTEWRWAIISALPEAINFSKNLQEKAETQISGKPAAFFVVSEGLIRAGSVISVLWNTVFNFMYLSFSGFTDYSKGRSGLQ